MIVLPATSAGAIFHTASRIGKVPRHDRSDHPQRGVPADHPAIIGVLDNLLGQRLFGDLAEPRDRAVHLPLRHRAGLSLFGGEQSHELLGVGLEPVTDRRHDGLPLGQIGTGPAGNAARAACTAASSWAGVADGTVANTWRFAGLNTGSPVSEMTGRPSMVITKSASTATLIDGFQHSMVMSGSSRLIRSISGRLGQVSPRRSTIECSEREHLLITPGVAALHVTSRAAGRLPCGRAGRPKLELGRWRLREPRRSSAPCTTYLAPDRN